MQVLLTGGGGFLGSYLCRALLNAGHEVAVLSRDEAPWRLREVLPRLRLIRGDLAAIDRNAAELQAFAPDAVAHLAWSGVANFDRNNPDQIKNIGWTADLLRVSREAGAKVFLGLGSQAEYGPQSAVIASDAETRPTTLYGEAKLAAGRIGAKLAAVNGMRFVWMRVFSTYGPADNPYWMIPGMIGSLLRGERPALTAGEQLWDFLHAADAARAIRLGLESSAASGFYNLGSGEAPPLRETIEVIRDAIDPALPLGFGEVPYRPDQVMRLQADVSGLRGDCGWQPQIPLGQGLAETASWYRDNQWIYEAPRAA